MEITAWYRPSSAQLIKIFMLLWNSYVHLSINTAHHYNIPYQADPIQLNPKYTYIVYYNKTDGSGFHQKPRYSAWLGLGYQIF
jgi:hypothetical protein